MLQKNKKINIKLVIYIICIILVYIYKKIIHSFLGRQNKKGLKVIILVNSNKTPVNSLQRDSTNRTDLQPLAA